MRRYRTLLAACVLALVISALAGSAAAQERSLRIEEGRVYLDGELVPRQDLPAGLEIDDLTVHYTFSGDVRPVVQLGDAFYVIGEDGLRPAEEGERAAPMPPGGPFMRPFSQPDVRVEFRTGGQAPDHTVLFQQKAMELQEQARRMQELHQHLQEESTRVFPQRPLDIRRDERIRELESLAREMSVHAVEAARVAEDLPRIERQHYLRDIQRQNQALFDKLVTERELEAETHEMARRIRDMEEGDERGALVRDLRARLDDIFELKQENRRREVEQLQERLQDLQGKLQERERLRGEIVDRRLEQLIGENDVKW